MSSVIIREAKYEDEDLVQQLCSRNGMRQEDKAWQWIWNSNRLYDDKWPLGWVLVSNDTIVGFIGNIPRLYSYQGKNLIAGVGRAFVVDKMFRSHSLKLVAKFFSQKYADFLVFSSYPIIDRIRDLMQLLNLHFPLPLYDNLFSYQFE